MRVSPHSGAGFVHVNCFNPFMLLFMQYVATPVSWLCMYFYSTPGQGSSLLGLEHDHLWVEQVFLTPTHLGIAMEYAAGGELFDRIAKAGRFNEDEARFFFQQLISGVQYCHSQVQLELILLKLWSLLFSLALCLMPHQLKECSCHFSFQGNGLYIPEAVHV